MLKILFIEPYYGGSHKAFADGYVKNSSHDVQLLTMPARKWKWRMRGAAIWLAERLPDFDPDIVLASDFLDLAALSALAPAFFHNIPKAVYFHENQLTYPLHSETRRDYQFGVTNITTCLAADKVFFNSEYHMNSFIAAADALLQKMPDFIPHKAPRQIRCKSEVLPVGIEVQRIRDIAAAYDRQTHNGSDLRIIWNQRWEYDKNPEEFYSALRMLADSGTDFRLTVLGENFRRVPEVFDKIKKEFSSQLEYFGYINNREQYLHCLAEGGVVVSTAAHEFFGIAVLEAVAAGCIPLLPNRLSYPELIPVEEHEECIYDSLNNLVEKLTYYANSPELVFEKNYSHLCDRFSWEKVAFTLDAELKAMSSENSNFIT